MRCFLFVIAILLNVVLVSAQPGEKEGIGLSLSGGGAKGLAHIGILQAVDSAGLSIDAITGTSMGAVVGSLYAIGYSGKEIEKLVRSLDWNELFLSEPALNEVDILGKEEYGKYSLQFPLEQGKIKPYTGILEAQGIWEKFGELYFPVYDIRDFSRFDIPFLCVATDLSSGEPVILKEGDIISAIRASMAIPSVFTTVDIEGNKLVDGGVVLNFPVANLTDFGVGYRIGVNVSQGLLEDEKLNTPIDVLLQIAFYKDASNLSQQKELCDLLIEPPVERFSAASFNASDSIIDIGIETGKKFYPVFKALADSLNQGKNTNRTIGSRLPAEKNVVFDKIEVKGMSNNDKVYFIEQLGLETGKSYNAGEINDAVNNAYNTLTYKKINYSLYPSSPGHALIRFDVVKNPESFINFGLHYTPYSGGSIISYINSQNQLLENSRTTLKTNISENFRIKAKHQQFFSQNQSSGIELGGYYEYFKSPVYLNFEERLLYRSHYGYLDLNLFQQIDESIKTGLGIKKEWLRLKPDVSPVEFLKVKTDFWSGYLFVNYNTLDKPYFPHRGTMLNLKGEIIFGQKSEAEFSEMQDEVQFNDSVTALTGNYSRLNIETARYIPINHRTTVFYKLVSGINFNPKRSFLNYYKVGGLQNFLRNQITFAGLEENELNTNSIIGIQLGLQVQTFEKIYATIRANTALYNFAELENEDLSESNFLTGYAFSAGYSSFIGPIEASLFYNQKNRSFAGHVLIGFAF